MTLIVIRHQEENVSNVQGGGLFCFFVFVNNRLGSPKELQLIMIFHEGENK